MVPRREVGLFEDVAACEGDDGVEVGQVEVFDVEDGLVDGAVEQGGRGQTF